MLLHRPYQLSANECILSTHNVVTSIRVYAGKLLIKYLNSSTNGRAMSRSILVEDSTFFELSPALERVALSLNSDVTHHDQLIALSTVIMGEVGYYINDDNDQPFDPSKWRASGVYEIPMRNRLSEDLDVKLEAIPVGDVLILNVSSVNKSVKTRSMAVETLAFVNPYSSDLAGKFLDLKRLSHRFKDTLTTPIKNEILNAAEVTNPSLLGLPVEIQQKILFLLDPKSARNLQSCSKKFRELF
ncbi:F-box only protein 7-like [Diachasmimorpha longicaudata]|uniref:F-box only protein 7-like n=1 Tax=Diachasmimorpha longicaudata TaxID=58733 RepID=UPI0030B8794F